MILCAMGVAAVWAIRVPVFEEPDELAHADYVFTLFDVGHPFHTESTRLSTMASKQTTYLSAAVGYRAMRYNPSARVGANYGSIAYFRKLDVEAPGRSGRAPLPHTEMPYVAAMYPVGYYALEAATMLLASASTNGSLLAAFFAARLANVVLLGVTLLAAHVIFRRAGLSKFTSILAVAAVGFFPLESSISGYIQPDNLVAALFALTIAASLRPRGTAGATTRAPSVGFIVVGLLLSATIFTKVHYALALWLAIVPAVALRVRRATWLADSLALFGACVALPAVAYVSSSTALAPLGNLVSPRAWAATAGVHAPSLASTVNSLYRNGSHAFGDAFFGGIAFQGFWLHFGMRSGTIFPRSVVAIANDVIVAFTVVALALFVYVELKIAFRLVRVASARSPLTAIRLVLASTPVNVYC
ncbi:MAG: hypothetical protein IAI49_10025, partial [Candidatus Eremiobacteraeota bacterium]|nr:hypothetical protein [Candidatus Eremiobacteraeota bacterium]